MCDTCGCGADGSELRLLKPGENIQDHHHPEGSLSGPEHTYDHEHTHDHGHTHGPGHHHHDGHTHDQDKRVKVEQDVLGRNNLLAERNRGYFEARNILALNLVSSPGSGKTSLLERTIMDKREEFDFRIIEGDQQTLNDARRIQEAGAPVVQVNTGEGCHLDAEMVNRAVKQLEPPEKSVLIIENVGNLVCPAMFDLGETTRIVIMSVTEGEDKPLKYPYMFRSSQLCIINKTDLLPYLDFDMEKARSYALQVNPRLRIIELSVKSGEGLEQWFDWLKEQITGDGTQSKKNPG